MTDDELRKFWEVQTSSLHRSSDDDFYRHKAEEHAGLMEPDEKSSGCVDLGCGAGELLYYFSDHAKIDLGLDYSASMLDEARRRLEGKSIALSDADAFAFLAQSTSPTWTTTGALNQYLAPDQLADLTTLFTANESARSFFLFDCVDPVRYAMLSCGTRYQRESASRRTAAGRAARRRLRVIVSLLQVARIVLSPGRLQRDWARLPDREMGYGYLPSFWLRQAHTQRLSIEIVSSRYYEYRYHVILRKLRPHG